ncbi:divergent polysaccharide deacetylase family protein [Roseobacter sp. YSTF-M11]|uniref:Divergent polysaccharide deacetylase family protein n=2 Tax=Roseobacter insulae TaxID=2859783 RepID=A0A9X1FUL3_9RHOB|nr:divergent polysaccharide deacetylase family protein [Roseobacter insulae]
MAIVLMDDGVDLSADTIGLPALRSFPYPVSFAVDTSLPDAKDRMAAYRAEGFEVLAMVDLPQGARARDAEISMSVALEAIPEAVGVLEGVGEGVQGTRDAARQVTEILAASGHGFVTQNKGLNTVQKLAAKAGVPSAVVFRDFDSSQQTPTVIRRFLDQAAFRADNEGGVIMLGRLREDTISALLLWALQDRAKRVALVPVSAALTTQ